MKNKKEISNLLEEYSRGKEGKGPIIWHKKPHRNGSGEFACYLGIKKNCKTSINCKDCYTSNSGGYCLKRGGEPVGGFLVVEYKHANLVEAGNSGMYKSLAEALRDLN